MNDETSTFHVEIAGPVADIHKLSSWVVVVVFFFCSEAHSAHNAQ